MTEEESTLDMYLLNAIEDFEAEREAKWAADPDRSDSWSELVEGLAELFVDRIDQLEAITKVRAQLSEMDHEIEMSFPRGFLEMLGPEEEFTEQVQIALAKKYATDTGAMAERCLALGEWAVEEPPKNETVLNYLERLSRCYTLGLKSECVILCRAVLENALKHAYQAEDAKRPADQDDVQSLQQDIEGAAFYGWFDEADKRAAHQVRHRGNKAVHNDPYTTQQVYETVEMTLDLVRRLV